MDDINSLASFFFLLWMYAVLGLPTFLAFMFVFYIARTIWNAI